MIEKTFLVTVKIEKETDKPLELLQSILSDVEVEGDVEFEVQNIRTELSEAEKEKVEYIIENGNKQILGILSLLLDGFTPDVKTQKEVGLKNNCEIIQSILEGHLEMSEEEEK